MRREERDAQRAARRARRLAERAEERAVRAERRARRAAERAERLNGSESRRRPGDQDQSFEDMVDDFAERAENWIEERAREWTTPSEEREIRRAERDAERARDDARRARENADRATRAAEDLSDYEDSVFDDAEAFGSHRPRRRKYGSGRSRRWRRRRQRSAHLYRDKSGGKFLGVCAGYADYFGRAPWEIRMYAVLGLFIIPSVVVPAYFISYFIMDDKPYYRRVTDRFDEDLDLGDDSYEDGKAKRRKDGMSSKGKVPGSADDPMENVHTMKTARDKFSDIEQRLRDMESHVTSSRFELQREFRRIAGDE